jgi:hypothetical protein
MPYPPPSLLTKDNLAGATEIVPFDGSWAGGTRQQAIDPTISDVLGASEKPPSTLNVELLLSGPSIVPFNGSMQVPTMRVLSSLLEDFPHKAELRTVGVRP